MFMLMILMVSAVSLTIVVCLLLAERAVSKDYPILLDEQPVQRKEWHRFNPVYFG